MQSNKHDAEPFDSATWLESLHSMKYFRRCFSHSCSFLFNFDRRWQHREINFKLNVPGKLWQMDKTSIVTCSCSTRCRTCSVTMTQNSTNESPSVLQDGKLKSGIYKIWNVLTETYVDIEAHSRSVCCRPARDLEEGNGLVRLRHQFVVHTSNDYKWEIKPLGTGYSVRRVSAPM